jgi:chromosome segregation ATPase
MKRQYVTGILVAVFVLGSQVAMGSEQQGDHHGATAKEVVGGSRVWIKKEITPAEQDSRKVKELQEKLDKSNKMIVKLQYKLASMQQGTQDMEQLQDKLASCKTEVDGLKKKLATALQQVKDGDNARKQLQADLKNAEAMIEELHGDLEVSAQTIEQLKAQVAEAESRAQAVKALVEEPLTVTECDALRAQVIGLEKLVSVKEAALEKVEVQRRNWKINRDALVSRVSALQAEVEQLREERDELAKDLLVLKQTTQGVPAEK